MAVDEFVWLEYPETGGKQRFPVEAVGGWTARGWVTCDPPVEPDPTKSDGPAEPEPQPPEQAEPAQEPDEEPMSAADTAADTEEGAE